METKKNETHFYEMWSSIYTLEALLESSPDRAVTMSSQKMWRILWDDASAKITTYLRHTTIACDAGESRAEHLLADERAKLQNEIEKISTFKAEAGDALWKNSATVYIVSTNVRFLIQSLRRYLERERQLLMPQKGAAA